MMKNTKQIKQNLKKYYSGQLSRADIISMAKDYLKQNISDPLIKEILDLVVQSSIKNNQDYKRIEEIRLQLWPYLKAIDKEVEDIKAPFLYTDIKNQKFENPDSYKEEYTKALNFLIREYLNDGMSEHYFIELVSAISFANNYTKVSIYEFSDIDDYEYSYLYDIDSPRKAPWNLEEQLHKYLLR